MKQNLRIFLSTLWLLSVVSIGVWWLHLGLRQAESVAQLKKSQGGHKDSEADRELLRFSRMWKMEGYIFILLLATGGGVMIYFSYLDLRRSKMIKEFFAIATHEMKTPIASLRLQAEALEEETSKASRNKILTRLLEDTKRIELQMDKALYLASIQRAEILFFEKFDLMELLNQIQSQIQGPNIHMQNNKPFMVYADKKALESIFQNLLENSRTHGHAKNVYIHMETRGNFHSIQVNDDGNGFSGNVSLLGKPFFRHASSSRTGIGIFLLKSLVNKMGGRVEFPTIQKGFSVKILLPVKKNE